MEVIQQVVKNLKNSYYDTNAKDCYEQAKRRERYKVYSLIYKAVQNGEFSVIYDNQLPIDLMKELQDKDFEIDFMEHLIQPWKDNSKIIKTCIKWSKNGNN